MTNTALMCAPADTFNQALSLSKKDRGRVDVAELRRQHINYCAALNGFEYNVIAMHVDNNHPDSPFVEDPAVIIDDIIIFTRLRKLSRRGEVVVLEDFLTKTVDPQTGMPLISRFSGIFRIEPPSFIEGGDVLVTDGMLYIGLSGRTNGSGAIQLAEIAHDHAGFDSKIFPIPKDDDHLHLVGGVSYHRPQVGINKPIIIVCEDIAEHFANSGCHLIETPVEERFGANCISQDGKILVHASSPRTKALLERAGFEVILIDLSEFAKKDGAMTCLSKFLP